MATFFLLKGAMVSGLPLRVVVVVALVPALALARSSHVAWSDKEVVSGAEIAAAADAVRARMGGRAWTNCTRWEPNRHQTASGIDSCYLVPPLVPGARPLIYHMVRKCGSTSFRQGLSDLARKYLGQGLTGRPVACTDPALVRARAGGDAFEFAVSREPLDKFLSSFHYLGRDVPANATRAEDRLDLLVAYIDHRVGRESNSHAFDQAFWCADRRSPPPPPPPKKKTKK